MGIGDADSVEHGAGSGTWIIVPVSCALPGRAPGAPKLSGSDGIRLLSGSMLARICGSEEIREEFFCNYEVNPDFEKPLAAAGLHITGRGPRGEVRAVELPQNDFFLATLFQPQLTSEATGEAHPVLLAYLEAAQARRSAAADD